MEACTATSGSQCVCGVVCVCGVCVCVCVCVCGVCVVCDVFSDAFIAMLAHILIM